MKIRVTKYNEVDPKELTKLFEMGAELIKSNCANGVCLGSFRIKTVRFQSGNLFPHNSEYVRAYSDDDIRIHNVTLPLSVGGEYDCEIEIN